ncbi:hypothetical protein A1D22_09175 [Pasteurellaceae bacterium LFhippo2]|nr:hypothetical protein [Pasteurellaceae bacterium LFhippo2]
MSNETTKKNYSFNDLYTLQAEAFYDLIMDSNQEWRKQWADEAFAQRNAKSDDPYNNMNQSLLFRRAVKDNMDDPRWLTFAQAKEKGFKIKKGAKSSSIYRLLEQSYDRKLKDENGNIILDEKGKEVMETVRYDRKLIVKHNVFNARDIDGIEPFKRAEIPEAHKQLLQQENYANAESMVKAFCEKNGIALQEMASEQAFYLHNNGTDDKKVVVPLKSQFDNLDDYFSVLFHEVAHSSKVLGIRINTETDHAKGNNFGSKNYAKEELTAELTALFLCKQFSIDSTHTAEQENNSFAYLKGWINNGLLDKDDFLIAVKEANRASKAIAEHAPKVTLSLDDIKQNDDDKVVKHALEWALSEKRLEPDYITLNKVRDNNLDWETLKENVLNITDQEHRSQVEIALDTQRNYAYLRDEANRLHNGGEMYIDFAERLLGKNQELNNYETAIMQASIGFDNFNDLSVRADNYLIQFENIKDVMLNKDINSQESIESVAFRIILSENPTELKAVVSGILEDMEKSQKINNADYEKLHNSYFEKINHTEKYAEVAKLNGELFELWQNWDKRENYDQFLKLTNFERNSTENDLDQEKRYFYALIEEFKQTGDWQKLNPEIKVDKQAQSENLKFNTGLRFDDYLFSIQSNNRNYFVMIEKDGENAPLEKIPFHTYQDAEIAMSEKITEYERKGIVIPTNTNELKDGLYQGLSTLIDQSLSQGQGLGLKGQDNVLSDDLSTRVASLINDHYNQSEAKAILNEILETARKDGYCNQEYQRDTLNKVNSDVNNIELENNLMSIVLKQIEKGSTNFIHSQLETIEAINKIKENKPDTNIYELAEKLGNRVEDPIFKGQISNYITSQEAFGKTYQDLINVGNKKQELSQGLAHYINHSLHPEKITADRQLINHLSKVLGKDKLIELRKEADNYLRQDLNNAKPKKIKNAEMQNLSNVFTQKVNNVFTEKNTLDILLLSSYAKGKSFEENTMLKPNDFKQAVELGYIEYAGKKPNSYNTNLYQLTEKGQEVVNNRLQAVLKAEDEKQGKPVTKKEAEEMIASFESLQRNHAGGREEEFAKSNYPQSALAKLDNAQALLERPFNKHSIPYQGSIERAIERTHSYLEKWDNLNQRALINTDGERITNIKILWTEANNELQNKSFGTDLNRLQEAMKDAYTKGQYASNPETNPLHENTERLGYDKWKFEITYQDKNGQIGKTDFRLDVNKNEGNFNPLTTHIKQEIERIYDMKFIEQKPKLTAEIKQEREAEKIQTAKIVTKPKGVTLH